MKVLLQFILLFILAISAFAEAVNSWPQTMQAVRKEKISKDKEYREAKEKLDLKGLKLSPWYFLEFRRYDEPVKEPIFNYKTDAEKRFMADGKIDLKADYVSTKKANKKIDRRRFKRIGLKDSSLWTKHSLYRNHVESFYRTITADKARNQPLYIGFSEGCKVYLNGKKIFAELLKEHREGKPNQAKVDLPLKKGVNHLLVTHSAWKRPHNKCGSYYSFNPVKLTQLREEVPKMEKNFPLEIDWFTQDLKRSTKHDADRETENSIPNNITAFMKGDRDSQFEQELIKRVLAELKDKKDFQQTFDKLVAAKAPVTDVRWLELYVKACQARRLQRLANLKKKYPKILFAKRKMLRPSFYGYTEGLSCANFEFNFVPGSSLCLLEWQGDEPVVTELLTSKDGAFRDIDVSADGKRILFAWKKSKKEDDYHLYEMSWPDKKVRQLTFGLGVADFEGVYLPNGNILFQSSRCISTTDCWTTEVSNLYTCDKDGKFMRRIGFDQVVTAHPSVLENGSVVYTRWDYNDRGQVFPQGLFQMNPDGTGQTEYYGNNSWFPTTTNHARGIPGTGKVLAVLHGHHSWQAGKLAVIDRSKGTQETKGVELIAPRRQPRPGNRGVSFKRKEDGWVDTPGNRDYIAIDAYGQDGNLHRHPYPLSEDTMVVAMTPYHNARKQQQHKLNLYWMDHDGHRELLVADPTVSAGHPIPLAPKKVPYQRASMVDLSVPYGTFFMQDIYEGPGLKGIKRGTVKKLRVVEIEYRALKIGNNNSGGRGGGAMSSTPISIGNGAWDVKKILGEAKVYEDGSAMFKVPANTPVYFQAIDENGSMVQTMRSWSTLMPNETFGCVGCHEAKDYSPPVTKTTLAMQAGAQDLEPFYGPARGFSYPKEVQPILDKHCISCHNGTKKSDTGKLLMDLTSKPVKDPHAQRSWTRSYVNLTHSKNRTAIQGNADHRMVNWVSAQSIPSMIPPRYRGSHQSNLIKMLRTNHGKTKLSKEEMDKLCAWIDLGVPFCGDYVEANTWDNTWFNKYIQMQRKRERLATEVRRNTEALHKKQTGQDLKLKDPDPRYLDYIKKRGTKEPAAPQAKISAPTKAEYAKPQDQPAADKATTNVNAKDCVTKAKDGVLSPLDAVWKYAERTPGPDWNSPKYNDSKWEVGRAGFGVKGTPGIRIHTHWKGKNIWLRRKFVLDKIPSSPVDITFFHDEDVTVYLNGKEIFKRRKFNTKYETATLKQALPLVKGENLLAVSCFQTGGGQGVDIGLSKSGTSAKLESMIKAAKTEAAKSRKPSIKKPKTEKIKIPTTGYRNVALNPNARDGSFPTATSNSEFNKREFAAINAINGKTDNHGHGRRTPSWGPHKRYDLWFKIDFGKKVTIDKAKIWIRADFKPYTNTEHDSWWKTGVMEFSDGSKLPFELKKIDTGQEIKFPKRKVSWVKFTKLVPDENKWCAFTEVEIWGE